MDLMSLLIRIGADISGAQKGMEDVQKGMEDTAKKSSGFGSKMSAAFGTVVKAGAGLAAGVVAAGAAVTKLATSAAATTDRIDKMSQKIGISRESYQEMDFIMSQSGGSVESLQMGMKTLRTSMVAAANGTKANVDKFKKLGVSVKNSSGQLRSQEDVMFDTLAALQKVGDETERTALATELFGKAGVELVPLLNSGAGSIEEMKKKAHDLGLVLDDDAIDAGVKLTDTIDQVKRSFDSIMTKIGVSVMPVVQSLLDIVLDNMPLIQTVVGGFFGLLGKVIGTAVSAIGTIKKPLVNFVTYIINTFGPTFSGIYDTISGTLSSARDKADEILGAIWDKLVEVFGGVGQWVEDNITGPIRDWWTGTVQPWIDGLADKLQPVKDDFNAVVSVIEGIFNGWNTEGDLFEVLKQLEKDIVSFVDGVVPGFRDFYDTLLKPMGIFIGGVFKTAWNGIVTLFTETIPAAVEAIRPALHDFWTEVIIPFAAFIKATFATAWDGIVTLFTETIPAAVDAIRPALHDFWTEIIIPFAAFIKATFATAWDGVIDLFTTGIPNAVAAIREVIGAFWKEVIIPFATFVQAHLAGAWEKMANYWTTDLGPKLTELGKAFSDFWNGPLTELMNFLSGAFTNAWNGILKLFGVEQGEGVKGSVNGVSGAFKYLWDYILKPVVTWIEKDFSDAFDVITTLLSGLITFLTKVFEGDWKGAWDSIVTTFGTVFGKIKDKVKAPVNAVIRMLNSMISKIENAINKVINAVNSHLRVDVDFGWNPFTGQPLGGIHWGANLQQVTMGRIPLLANGGTVMSGGQAIVGEAGPEYLRVVNGKAIVTPTTMSGSGGDTYNVSISINQQPGQDPRELAEIIQRELVRIGRQKRAVYA